jgi:hypothetical protein
MVHVHEKSIYGADGPEYASQVATHACLTLQDGHAFDRESMAILYGRSHSQAMVFVYSKEPLQVNCLQTKLSPAIWNFKKPKS